MWKEQFQTEGESCSGKDRCVQIRSRVPQVPNEADVPRYSGDAGSLPPPPLPAPRPGGAPDAGL